MGAPNQQSSQEGHWPHRTGGDANRTSESPKRRGVAKARGLPTAAMRQPAHGGPHVGGQSADEGDGQRPEREVEEQTHGPTSGNRSDCSPASIWRSSRTARDTSRASGRIKSQSSSNRVRRNLSQCVATMDRVPRGY